LNVKLFIAHILTKLLDWGRGWGYGGNKGRVREGVMVGTSFIIILSITFSYTILFS